MKYRMHVSEEAAAMAVIENTETIADTAETDPAFIETMIDPGYIIDGGIRIRSGFYLHVDVDLFYFTAIPQQNRVAQTTDQSQSVDPFQKIPVQLQESRKIKLNELHYFDHPMFGLMVQVSRL